MTVAEDLLLLAYRNDTGRPRVGGTQLNAALAGAAIVELTLAGALRLTETDEPGHKKGRLVATGTRPDDPRLADLVAVADGRKPKDAVAKVAGFGAWRNPSRNLREALLHDLADAGQFTSTTSKILGLFPTTAWKPNPTGDKPRIEQRVRAATVDGTSPDDRTAALISILHAVDLLPKLFPDADKRALKRRAKEISESEWGGPAVRKAVQEVQAVTVAVIVATTTAANAGS
ncbi:GOLPH3/VPS74 family protein [Nocardia blacklockiae]|uniref:GOLPH3/VPS74 family protein n=1 Tax=Nocardia blacklockiae TaxID=480036 RepID=UPI0018963C11|nr:GPP34 family phosphoprotein [Nocardia blacklockiae]MBF6175980.1 GPP34 family phosphoprotein [Nocardia blacklockiae]